MSKGGWGSRGQFLVFIVHRTYVNSINFGLELRFRQTGQKLQFIPQRISICQGLAKDMT